jgi:hypothetical protein
MSRRSTNYGRSLNPSTENHLPHFTDEDLQRMADEDRAAGREANAKSYEAWIERRRRRRQKLDEVTRQSQELGGYG